MPLDGGRLIEVLFLRQNHTIRTVFTIISIVGLAIFSLSTQNLFFLIIPISMTFELIMEMKNQKIRNYLSTENINYTVTYNDLTDTNYWLIRDCILLSFSKRYSGVQAGVHTYSIIEAGLINHVSAILKTPFLRDVKWLEKTAIILTYILFMIVIPTMYILLMVK
jgi:hypothetical protein